MMAMDCCPKCGGPTLWTLDVHDQVWYICQSDCEGFRQIELFPGELEPWDPSGVVDPMRGDESDGSAVLGRAQTELQRLTS